MSNSSLVNYTKISPNSTNPRNHKIDTITIHHIAGVLSAREIANLNNFTDPKYESSCNYAVGNEGDIALIVEEKNRSWCTSSRANDHRAITIEVSNSQKGEPWPVSDKALEATINLCVDICKRNDIKEINFTGDKSGNLTMHKWFANTNCPGAYLSEKFPYIAEEINKRLGNNNESENTPVPQRRELHFGDNGEDVKQLQEDLIELKYDLGKWGADGDFGEMTEKAVRKLQDEYNLTVDGWVGEKTYAAIETALNEKRKPTPAPTPAPTKEIYYRVRKSWEDANSQIGAYTVLENAINACKTAGSDYKIYDSDGIQVYPELKKEPKEEPFMVRITAKVLNVRTGPSTSYSISTIVKKNEAYTIVDTQNNWGKLKSGAGCICLDYVLKL